MQYVVIAVRSVVGIVKMDTHLWKLIIYLYCLVHTINHEICR